MDSLKTYLQQQIQLTQSSTKYVSLINSPHVSPIRLKDELESLDRTVQFISLNEMETKNLNLLTDTIDDFLNTGFDLILNIGSIEILYKYLELLINWKNRKIEKNRIFEKDKTGMLYLLVNKIDRNLYPVLLQNLVDFEYQEDLVI